MVIFTWNEHLTSCTHARDVTDRIQPLAEKQHFMRYIPMSNNREFITWNDPPRRKPRGRVTSKKSKNASDKSNTSPARWITQVFIMSRDINGLKLHNNSYKITCEQTMKNFILEQKNAYGLVSEKLVLHWKKLNIIYEWFRTCTWFFAKHILSVHTDVWMSFFRCLNFCWRVCNTSPYVYTRVKIAHWYFSTFKRSWTYLKTYLETSIL